MYNQIEKEYKKQNPYKSFDIYYWICSLALSVIFIGLSILKISNYILLPIMFLVLILLIIVYLLFDMNKVLSKKELNSDFFQRIVIYIDRLNQKCTNNLVTILNKKNINKKSDIQMLINYYNGKRPVIIQTNIWDKISTFAITIASFVVIGYNDNTKQIDSNKLAFIFSSTLGIILFIVIITFGFKSLLNEIKPPKQKLYSLLEEELTYIYMNFDHYKNQLSKKKS